MKVLALLFCLLAASAVEVRADTLVITGGFFQVTGPTTGQISFSINGDNFSFAGQDATFQFPGGCFPCLAGSVLPSSFSTAAVNNVGFTMNGVVYESPNFAVGNGFAFTAPTHMVANSVTVPFTFNGFVSVSDTGPGMGLLFTHTLVGQGFVTIDYSTFIGADGRTFFSFQQATYNFTPVPEPATLLLLGTGLAGVGVAARKRRKARRRGAP